MRLRDIPPIVRAAVSLLCLAAGFFLLYITWLDGDDEEPAQQIVETPQAEQFCPPAWRDFDNTALRFKVCLPSNMVFSSGTGTQSLSEVNQQDPSFINDFHVVNLAWLNPWPAIIPQDPALPPLRIAIRTPAADLGIEGCALRGSPVGAKGVQSCSDLFFIIDGQAIPDVSGDFHRYRALVPSAGPVAAPLFFQAASMTAAWNIQGPLVQQVLDSIRPY